ncbi:hypothetical protein VTN31DRAFT_3968 [Thermomyces dupontii]|uniref:uncharacterized protein n=1 Tax=Talaromyces thermophilus TaxID=28565 RepID=UPI003742DF4C
MAEDLSIYFYDPSLGAAILFTVLYTPPFLWHLWCVAVAPRTRGYARTLYYIPMVIGAAFEVIGYAVRCGSTRSPNDVGLYASSATFIVLAPVFICASLYMLIARLVPSTTDDELSGQDDAEGEKEQQKLRILWIKPRWLPRLFVRSDIFSLLLQSSGSVIALSNDWEGEKKDIGLAILITGLVLQAVTVTLFLVIVLTARRRAIAARKYNLGLKMVIRGVVIGVCLILARSIYRVVEFTEEIPGYIFEHEWLLYVLEALPMWFALLVLAWYHPGRWLVDKVPRYPSDTELAETAVRRENSTNYRR